MKQYLQHDEIIDWQHPDILAKAKELATDCDNEDAIIKNCFEFIRDAIQHSSDYQRDEVTCKASDVLLIGTGWCYAKSHLLAALLRANGIPAGLCYQRLTIDGDKGPYCLHGLNAVYRKGQGWYRMDARGNKPGVAAFYMPPKVQLAFPIQHPGESDITGIWPDPLPMVVKALTTYSSYEEIKNNLPDVEMYND